MSDADPRPRDSQRARLYRAEGQVGAGRRLPTVERMQAWVDAMAATDWFLARWGARTFDVRPGFGHRRATADQNGVLQMPKWARTELVLVHEVSHCLTPPSLAPHGAEYAGVLLTVARRALGPGTAQLLEDAFARERVRWTLSAVPDVRPSVANSRQTAAWASTAGASVGDGPTASLIAAHQRDLADMDAQRSV